MKTKKILLLTCLLLTGAAAFCQQSLPAQVQEDAESAIIWVLETQPGESPYSIVRFFDQADTVIHETRYEGISLDIHQPQTQAMLTELTRIVESRIASKAQR